MCGENLSENEQWSFGDRTPGVGRGWTIISFHLQFIFFKKDFSCFGSMTYNRIGHTKKAYHRKEYCPNIQPRQKFIFGPRCSQVIHQDQFFCWWQCLWRWWQWWQCCWWWWWCQRRRWWWWWGYIWSQMFSCHPSRLGSALPVPFNIHQRCPWAFILTASTTVMMMMMTVMMMLMMLKGHWGDGYRLLAGCNT